MAAEGEEETERVLQDVREISGTDDGFLTAVAAGVLAMPRLMSYNEWSSWRSGEGRRPKRVLGDPRTTTQVEEAALWRRPWKFSTDQIGEQSFPCGRRRRPWPRSERNTRMKRGTHQGDHAARQPREALALRRRARVR